MTIVFKGWTCACGIFNGEEKAERPSCRTCDRPRPLEAREARAGVGDYVLPRRDEGMYAGRTLARIVPAGVGIKVGDFVLVTEGEDRGRMGMVLSWRDTDDGIGHQVTFAVQPWESTAIVQRVDRTERTDVSTIDVAATRAWLHDIAHNGARDVTMKERDAATMLLDYLNTETPRVGAR